MREPPDFERKTPPRVEPQRGQIKNIAESQPKWVKTRNQQLAYFPIGRAAADLRDDPLVPIRVRVFALQAGHRLQFGGRINPDDANLIRRLDAARRRTLAALGRIYR